MNNRMIRRVWGLLLMVPLLMNGGCSPMYYGSARPSTAESRIEAELVTHAELVRVDTSPFPHGRFAFRRGADHLLVLTRITSFATDGSGNLHKRQDAIKERVWITIPFGAPMGHELSLEELEQVFNAGYDRAARQDGNVGYLIRPNKTTGRVSLDELGSEKAVVTISARIAPRGISTFEIHEKLEVPVTTDGIHATMVVEEKMYHHDPADWRRINRQVPASPVGSDPTEPDEAGGGEGVDNTEAQSQLADRDTPAVGAGKLPPNEVPNRSIVGQWLGHTPKHGNDYYEVHFQFNPNGSFVHSTGRGGGTGDGYAPGMKYGVYRIHKNVVLMEVKKFVFRNLNHLNDNSRLITLKIDWKGRNLVLTGDYKHPLGDPAKFGKNLTIELESKPFPDLRVHRPAANLRGTYVKDPEPTANQIINIQRSVQ